MPPFQIDDQFAFHSKTLAAGNEAIGLFARAGAWCAGYLTDGVVADHIATTLGHRRLWDVLVRVGLVEVVENGYRLHDYLHWNKSASEIAEERVRKTQNMRDLRAKKRAESKCGKSVADHKPTTSQSRDRNVAALWPACSASGSGSGSVKISPRGETPKTAPTDAPELKLDGEPKPAKQKKLPLPKPLDPTAEAMGEWRKLWSEKYQGCKYVDASGEFKQLRELVAKANDAAKELAADDPEAGKKLLAHWFSAYLADSDDNGFIRSKRHGLRWLAKEITRYGTPWDQEPRDGVFGRETTTGPTHYACAAHRPLKLKPEPPPPTKEELDEMAAQFAALEGMQ